MKKIGSLITACCLSLGMCSMLAPQSFSASAASDSANPNAYTLRIVPERTTVSSEELAAGDVIIPASIYITGSTENQVSSVKIKYNSDDSHIYFQNMKTASTRYTDDRSYTCSAGTFQTKFEPYCFGILASNGKTLRYNSNCSMIATTEYALDPIFGASLRSNGEGGVKFSVQYYQGVDTDGDGILERDTATGLITHEYSCPVTVDENGNGTFSYTYIRQDNYQEDTATKKLPRYDASLPVDALVPDTCDSVSWLTGTSTLSTGAAFLGAKSNEFPFMQVDIVIQQDTPDGLYHVNFGQEVSAQLGPDCSMDSSDHKKYDLSYENATISVGDISDVTVTSVEKDDTALYTAEDTSAIKASDFAASIQGTVTYADGTVAENADITDLVDCKGATPENLYTQLAGSNGYVKSNVQLYCQDIPLKWNSEPLTQHVLVGKKGDVDFDGSVTLDDSFAVLSYYSKLAAGADVKLYSGTETDPAMEQLAFYLADTDTCSKVGKTDTAVIDIDDAFNILQYYSAFAAGSSISWDKFAK